MGSKNIWISHTSIVDFENCSRLYYFKNIYRSPNNGNRVQIVNPYLSLGSAVHEAIDGLLDISPSRRSGSLLLRRYEQGWRNYSGKKGGFVSGKQEGEFKKRGELMLKRVEGSSLLKGRALKRNDDLPKMNLFNNVNLVGSFDWVEILSDNSLHIVDFKTGRKEEKHESLQLPIYNILARETYERKIKRLSYWYLDRDLRPTSQKIGRREDALQKIKEKAEKIQAAVNKSNFSCSSQYQRCFWCRNYEGIVSGKAEYVGIDPKMKRDLYFLANGEGVLKKIYDGKFLNKTEKHILRTRMDGGSSNELKMSKKEIRESVSGIKLKVKKHLTPKELRIFVEELSKNKNSFNL